ncbi:MAG: autotransporter-associated beta strand repeat-containing protein [Pirellulales bacterium]|nr:autotransporter-associated beta strand repeat-containing protein [Pirellulales bacterium]
MKTLLTKLRIRLGCGAIVLLALSIAAAPVAAVNYTWTGLGADDSLFTAENWSPVPSPMFDTTTATTHSIIFTGSTRTSPTVPDGANPNFNNATFDANAAAFTIGLAGASGSFRLGSTGASTMRNLVNNSPNVQTFNAPVLISVATINAATAGFVFNSTYSAGSSTSSRRTDVTGNHDVWFNAGISGAGKDTTSADTAGAVQIKTTATAHIPVASASTHGDRFGGLWNGVFNIYTGALRIGHNDALGAGSATVQIPGETATVPGRTIIQGGTYNGRLELVGGITVSENFSLAARSSSVGFLPHIVSVGGGNTLTGSIDIGTGGSYYNIQSDGTAPGDLLTLAGNFAPTVATGNRYLRLQGAGNGAVSGNITNGTATVRLFKEDGGTWTITSSGNTYSSGTYIEGGTLALTGSGSIATTSQIQVNSGCTFDVSGVTGGLWTLAPSGAQNLVGWGTVKGNVQDTALGATISGGTLGAAGTLNFTNDLSLNGNGTLRFDLGPATTIGSDVNDLLSIGGNLSLAGTTSVVVNNTDTIQGFATGTYRLIDYVGSLTGNASNFTVSALGGTTRQNFAISTATPKQVNLIVTGAPLSLTWKGDGTTNAWDVATTANWNNLTQMFYNSDSVTFDDTGSNNPAVYLTASVTPGAIAVNNSAKDYVFGGFGAIVGNTGLTKSGTGKLTIDNSGPNTFTGAIALNGGAIEVGSGSNVGNLGTGAIALAAGTTLAFNRSDGITLANVLSGSGTLEQKGLYGLLDVTATNANFTGPVTISQGTLKWNSNNNLGPAAGLPDVTNNAILQLDSTAGSWTPNRTIVGTGAVEKIGANTISFNKAHTFNGGLTISAGTLQVGGTNQTEGALGAGAVVNNATLTFNRSATYTVANVIGGTGAVNFNAAAGVVTMTGDNTYDGNTSINDGTVILGSATGLGNTTGYTYITSNTAARLALTGGITVNEPIALGTRGSSAAHSYMPHILNLGGDNTLAGAITAGTGGSRLTIQSDGTAPGDLLTLSNTITNTTSGSDNLYFRGAGNGLVSGNITNGTGQWRIFKLDAGTWTFTYANTYTNSTDIVAGTLALKDSGTISASMAVVFQEPAAIFDVSQTFSQTFSMGASQGLIGIGKVVGNVATTSGSQIAPSGPVSITNSFTGSPSRYNYLGGTMTIQGASATTGLDLSGGESLTFKLTPNPASTANDKIQVVGRLNMLNLYGNTNVLIVPETALGPAGSEYTLLSASSQSGTSSFALDPNHNTRYSLSLNTASPGVVKLKVDSGSNANLIWAGTVNSVWDLKTTANWTGADGLFYQADAVSFTDAAPDDKLNVTIGDAANPYLYPASVTVDSSKNYIFGGTGSISSGATLTKSGAGTLTVNNGNDFNGTVTITGGMLIDGAGGALGRTSGGTVINGGTLDSNGLSSSYEQISVQGMGVGGNGALVNNSTAAHYFNYITLAGDATLGGTGNWNIVGPVQVNSGIATGYLHGNGYALTKVGTNEIDLMDLGETNLGDIHVNAGRLYVQAGTTLGNNANQITLANGAWLGFWLTTVAHAKPISIDATGGRIDTWGGASTLTSTIAAAGALTVSAADGAAMTLNGVISGVGGLTKINSNTAGGKVILGGNNTYQGPTLISAGTLELSATGQIAPVSAITNDAVFQVNGGTHTLGTIGGGGTMNVFAASEVTATSIAQNALIIGGVAPASAAAVPEPGTWLLLFAGLPAAMGLRRLWKR